MIRFFVFILTMTMLPLAVRAAESPAGQVAIDTASVLRGRFVEDHQSVGKPPIQSFGHFAVAPAYGLIWGIEKPFPTSTVVTANGAIQDMGGFAVKLPIKNLEHLYAVVGGALRGEWHRLETDFIITRSGDAQHWQMLMTPRPDNPSKLPYATITVIGSRFVEDIVLTKKDGSNDAIRFTDEILSPTPLFPQEFALFNEAAR